MDDSHECPIEGCKRRVPLARLMCGPHWKLVPVEINRQLYSAWNRGAGAGTQKHADAMQAACHAVETRLAS